MGLLQSSEKEEFLKEIYFQFWPQYNRIGEYNSDITFCIWGICSESRQCFS